MSSTDPNHLPTAASDHLTLPLPPIPNPNWRVWKTASALDEDGSSSLLANEPESSRSSPFSYHVLAQDSARILRCWGRQWAKAYESEKENVNDGKKKSRSVSSNQSLLNKPSLLHEVEESLVALRALFEWLQQYDKENESRGDSDDEGITVVDLCCGKGIFSTLLSYFASLPPPSVCGPFLRRHIKRCVMIDRMSPPKVNWSHIDIVNAEVRAGIIQSDQKSNEESAVKDYTITAAVPIDTWGGCNIHDESFPSKLRNIPGRLAVVGIHLCRHLGPRSVGLFNSLGKEKSPFFCMAPCCLPRIARKGRDSKKDKNDSNEEYRTVRVDLYETDREREKREEAIKLRKQARGSDSKGVCFLCSDPSHRARDCPSLPQNDDEERVRLLQAAAATAPCWKCGVVGHHRSNCPSTQKTSKPTLPLQPSMEIDVSKVLEANEPFDEYCHLLADAVQFYQGRSEVRDTTLVSDSSSHQEGNWNAARKAKFIVAGR